MSRVNENVVAALKLSVKNAEQPKEVAQRLVSWLDALARGSAGITDKNEAAKRISDLLDLVHAPSEQTDHDAFDSRSSL